jgi:hypothetical protein
LIGSFLENGYKVAFGIFVMVGKMHSAATTAPSDVSKDRKDAGRAMPENAGLVFRRTDRASRSPKRYRPGPSDDELM